jgi:DNA-binding transcriptional regulator GbsR (MarR family)
MLVAKKKLVKVIDVSEENIMTLADYLELSRQAKVLDTQIKDLKKRYDKMKTQLDDYVDSKCDPDQKGNRYFDITDSAGNLIGYFKREARTSIKLNDERARERFEELNVLDRVLKKEVVEKFDEDEIQALMAEEIIDLTDMQYMTDKNVTYASKFVAKKEADETEE